MGKADQAYTHGQAGIGSSTATAIAIVGCIGAGGCGRTGISGVVGSEGGEHESLGGDGTVCDGDVDLVCRFIQELCIEMSVLGGVNSSVLIFNESARWVASVRNVRTKEGRRERKSTVKRKVKGWQRCP